MEMLAYLSFFLILALTLIGVVAVAFKYGKPTIHNHGTVNNYYFGQNDQETSKVLPESNTLQLAAKTVEALKEINEIKNGYAQNENNRLEK